MTSIDIAEKVLQIIETRLASNQLELPVPPEAATTTLAMLQNKDVTQKELVRALKVDPVLVMSIIRVANSARFAGGVPSATIEQAITRLGLKNLRGVLMEACTRKLYASREPRIAGSVRTMFMHALAVASLGRDLASVAGSPDEDTVYLAGLLHDVGKVVLVGYLLEVERAIVGPKKKKWIDMSAWLGIVQKNHRPIGIAVAERWAFPEPVVAAVRECHEFDTKNQLAPRNFVCFANAVAKSQGIYEADTDGLDNTATIMLGRAILRLDDDMLSRLTADLHSRVESMA